MNKSVFYIAFLCSFCLNGQVNLVKNGSFETITQCYGQPAALGSDVFNWSNCEGWSNPIYSSSDLWCQNPIVGTAMPPNIIGVGYQTPRTGNNMAGIIIGEPILPNYREYIQNELISTLTENVNYLLTFYISVQDLPCTISDIGVKFLSSKYQNNSEYNLFQFQPEVVNNSDEYIIDTLGWQKISLNYLANGTETHLIIGSFSDSSSLHSIDCESNFSGQYEGNYFFIDDVSIIESEFEMPNVFTPNGDGINDEIDFSFLQSNLSVQIINRWGNLVFQSTETTKKWDNSEQNTSGVYFYIVRDNKKNKIFKTGFIHLISENQ